MPLADGPIRALALVPEWGRWDIFDLSNRIQLDLQCVVPGELDGKEAQKALQREHELLIVSDLVLPALPVDLLDHITNRVRNGTGLLLTRYGDTLPGRFRQMAANLEPIESSVHVTRGVGHASTPEWRDGLAFVRTGAFEQGRVAILDYGPPAPPLHVLLPPLRNPLLAEWEFHDTYLSLVAKAARWAARRDPEVWVDRIEAVLLPEPDKLQIPTELPPAFIENMRATGIPDLLRTYTVHLNGPAHERYSVVSQIRQSGRNTQLRHHYPEPIRKSQESYTISVPAGPGDYLLDLWFFDKRGRVEEWHTESISVPGWPRITRTEPSKQVLFPHNTLPVTLDVEAPMGGLSAPIVYVRALDAFGRLVAEGSKQVPKGGGTVDVRLEFADLIARQVKIEYFALYSDSRSLSDWDLRRSHYRHEYLPVCQPDEDPAFSLLARLDGRADYHQRLLLRELARLGVDTVYTHAREDAGPYILRTGLRPLFELTRFIPEVVVDDVVRVPSLSDEDFRRGEAERLRERTGNLWETPSALFSLGDGNCLSAVGQNLCQSRSSLNGFRTRLERQYRSLAGLNTAWGTQFGQWDQVAPAPEEAASALGVYAPWLDFRLYMDTQFTEAHVTGRDAVRAVQPAARVGFSARRGGDAYAGYDWYALASKLDILGVPADELVVEKVRCYRRPDAYAGLCLWHNDMPIDEARARWYPWYAALHDLSGVWWGLPGEDAEHALGLPALSAPEFQALAASIDRLRGSVAALLREGDRPCPDIALYDSQASRYLSLVMRPRGPSTPDAERAFCRLLEDLGHQYDFVTREQAADGELDKYRALILPATHALTDAEADAIGRFHEGGGHVLADVQPGKFDGHGLPRSRPALARVFGISEPSQDGSTSPSDDPPEWKRHSHGEALAVLIGRSATAYDQAGEPDEQRAWRSAMDALLSEVQVNPPARVSVKGGHPFPGECVAIRYGSAKVLALLCDPVDGQKANSVTLLLSDPGIVYDALAGLRVTGPKKIRVRVGDGSAAVFTSLPYEVVDLAVECPAEAIAGKRLNVALSLKTKGGLPGDHLIRLELAPAMGEPIRHYSQTVLCPNGKGTAYIPLAANDRPGRYTVRARDALTGITREAGTAIHSALSAL